jgi:hypothetical protein
MASTYSSLKIQLMATGENSGTWGNVTNDNLGVALEEAIVGSADVTFASANVTLTLTDTNASQTARNLRLNLTGTTGGARDLIVPAIEKIYIVNNGCADTVTIKVTGQTGVAVPAGKTMYVYNNATDCTDAITHLRNLTLATALPVASGGTGANTLTAESVVVGNGTNAVKFVAPGTSTNVLTSNGTAWVSQAAATTTNANAITTGILSAGVGGTGANTLTSENVVIGNGTSAVKFVAPGTTGNVLTSNGSAWLSQAAAAGGGDYIMQVFTSPGTWTKPAGLKAVKVTVIGGGGACDGPPPQVTDGGTSSFGPFLSATGGGGAANNNSIGTGSGGQLNSNGEKGAGFPGIPIKWGGGAAFGFSVTRIPSAPGANAYGGGASGGPDSSDVGNGGGGSIEYLDAPALPGPVTVTVGAGGTSPAPRPGAAGVVIVEEFY